MLYWAHFHVDVWLKRYNFQQFHFGVDCSAPKSFSRYLHSPKYSTSLWDESHMLGNVLGCAILLFYFLRVFHSSFNLWIFNSVWVTSPGLFYIFLSILTWLWFGWCKSFSSKVSSISFPGLWWRFQVHQLQTDITITFINSIFVSSLARSIYLLRFSVSFIFSL